MPYAQRFVVTVLVNGVIQEEKPDGSVEIPFGSEYVLRFRNKHDRRAVVKLWIDGEEQSKGGYVIPPRSFKDIERNSYSPYKFKLVDPKGAESKAYGKDTDNTEGYNGVIEARFYLEKEPPQVQEVHHHHHHHHDHWPAPKPWRPYWNSTTGHPVEMKSAGGPRGQSVNCSMPRAATAGYESLSLDESAPLDDADEMEACMGFCESTPVVERERATARSRKVKAGVTVEGGRSNVVYHAVNIDLEDQFVPLKLNLRGYHAGGQVEEVVEVYDDEVQEAASKKAGRR